jgi:Fe-S-cluster-containing dehydrogenase component/DMSO reductase anchor subunit
MIRSAQLRLFEVVPAARTPPLRSTLLGQLLREQQDLSAVERFAVRIDRGQQTRFYDDVLPASPPGPGQQYAFRVDLDKCTGCKACVAGCHSMNGLDDGEAWRTVGLLHGGTPEVPEQRTVTTSCHHCIDPACQKGCPVSAYEKDPVTGIVKHLDDQCIGCQYCVFMCPYDAPKYNARLGIVRKCDLCSARLGAGEAPACVQACPTGAITIQVVDVAQVAEQAEGDVFLPGAPAPGATLPTTRYESARPLAKNLLPADFYQIARAHAHWPLVVMLVLTQLAVGAVSVHVASVRVFGFGAAWGQASAVLALGCGVAAIGASILHLGRPLFAFRALLGLRTSWLSREILGFSVFAGLCAAYAGSFFAPPELRALGARLALPVVGAGLCALACSVMVYVATRRPTWGATAIKFALTAVVLGAASVLLVGAVMSLGGTPDVDGMRAMVAVLGWAMGAKLLVEVAAFRHLLQRRHSAERRSATLMARELRLWTWARFACGLAGGLALPALGFAAGGRGLALAAIAFALCLGGELCERYLFFTAATAPRMPGALA